jgi:TRAP transporter TAXI family solute receptor
MNFRTVFLGLAATGALSLATVAQGQNISIGTGGTGGVYYPLGGGFAAALSKHVPGMQATAEVTGGSVSNLQLIATGKPYIGLSMVDAAKDAMNGEGKFKDKGKVNVRTLLVLYPNRMHVVTTTATGIKTLKDLQGKRMSVGSIGSATEVMTTRLLESAGVEVKRERLSVAESVNALKDGKIDAFSWVGGLPTAGVTDLASTPGITIQMIDHTEAIPGMVKKYGNLYYPDVIPMSTYKGMAADNKNASIANILVASEGMSDETAYKIVKTILEKQDELKLVHKAAGEIQAKNQKSASTPVPFHPGALKYFKEKGISVN